MIDDSSLQLRQREKFLRGFIDQLVETRQWMRENGYAEIWLRFANVLTYFDRELARTTKKRENQEAREKLLREGRKESIG